MTRFISPREDVKLLVVSVPEDAVSFELFDKESSPLALLVYVKDPNGLFTPGIPYPEIIPPGDYIPLGIATELPEEVLKWLVDFGVVAERGLVKRTGFIDYEENESHFITATESWHSLLRREGITERVFVLKVKN